MLGGWKPCAVLQQSLVFQQLVMGSSGQAPASLHPGQALTISLLATCYMNGDSGVGSRGMPDPWLPAGGCAGLCLSCKLGVRDKPRV